MHGGGSGSHPFFWPCLSVPALITERDVSLAGGARDRRQVKDKPVYFKLDQFIYYRVKEKRWEDDECGRLIHRVWLLHILECSIRA